MFNDWKNSLYVSDAQHMLCKDHWDKTQAKAILMYKNGSEGFCYDPRHPRLYLCLALHVSLKY